MTTHHEQPRDHLRLGRPGSLIAALPAVLGFVPEKSLVLVALEDGQMGAVMRADLSADLADNVGELAQMAGNAGAERVIAVIVDADGALCPLCLEEHRRLFEALTEALGDRGVEMYAGHVVDRVEAGGRWHCVDGCGSGGTVDDPDSSPLAAAAVLGGRRLYRRRAELQAVVQPADPEHGARLAALIEAESARREGEWAQDPDGRGRRDVEAAIGAARRVCDGAELDDAELSTLACALGDVVVRDTLYALAVGSDAGPAEALWAVLSRALPDPWRVEPLVLLAFSAYARGDGPLAGVSLEAALRSDPAHRMAGMLDTALRSGMRPDQIRDLAVTGYRVGRRLGVHLPPRRSYGRRLGAQWCD